MFILPVIGYWLAPDLMPFVPIDDLLFALLGSWLFVKCAEKEHSYMDGGMKKEGRNKRDYIDVEGHTVEEGNPDLK